MNKYKNAFKCSKCPQTNTELGCPVWWEYVETNNQTGAERVKKVCGFQAMPLFLTHTLMASNRPASEISAMRGEIANGLRQISEEVHKLPQVEKLDADNST